MKNIFLVAFAAILLSACATPSLVPSDLASRVQFTDENVYVKNIQDTQTDDGIIRITVFGGLASRYAKVVRYRLRWYDSSHTPIDTALSNWRELNVDGSAPFEFTAVAPGKRAVSYVIEFETR